MEETGGANDSIGGGAAFGAFGGKLNAPFKPLSTANMFEALAEDLGFPPTHIME